MKNKFFLVSLCFVAAFGLLIISCKKINEATELGDGVIPAVDNITTFDTTLSVFAYNDIFGLIDDSMRIDRGAEYFLGRVNNDPVFGFTDARMFLELKPSSYGVYPFTRKDSVTIDSIVLVLDYLETYGDTTIAQNINVYELDQSNDFRSDSAYLIRKENFTYNTGFPLSQPGQFFIPSFLNDTVKALKDTSANQLRLKLDTAFARRLFTYDTTNAYKSDSAFKSKFKGFAIRSESSGNAVMGFNLGGSNTKLAIYYNCPKVGGGGRDTTVNYFSLTSSSAAANYINRDYSGTPVLASAGGVSPDSLIYLQNSPGTYSILRIPDLPNLSSNKVIHRAELIAEEVFSSSSTLFSGPEALFLNYYDSTNNEYAVSLYDFYLNSSGVFNYSNYGCFPKPKKDILGRDVKEWKFNISRYVQGILTKKEKYYPLRLFAPYSSNFRYSVYDYGTGVGVLQRLKNTIGINSTTTKGRVVIDSRSNSASKLRLRIIYSKF